MATTILSCEALDSGDEIEAWHDGRLWHKGRVSQTVPSMGMFWIVCARTGARKLVDLEASEVIRVSSSSKPVPAGRKQYPPDDFRVQQRFVIPAP